MPLTRCACQSPPCCGVICANGQTASSLLILLHVYAPRSTTSLVLEQCLPSRHHVMCVVGLHAFCRLAALGGMCGVSSEPRWGTSSHPRSCCHVQSALPLCCSARAGGGCRAHCITLPQRLKLLAPAARTSRMLHPGHCKAAVRQLPCTRRRLPRFRTIKRNLTWRSSKPLQGLQVCRCVFTWSDEP